MPDWGGIIAGAVGGGAQVVGQQANAMIEDQRKLSIAEQLAALDEARQMRVMEAQGQQQSKFADEQVGRQSKAAAAERQAGFDFKVANQDAEIGMATKAGKAASEIEKAEMISKGKDPAYLSAVQALARAQKTPESAGSLAQAALASFELDQKRQLAKDQQALVDASTPEEEDAARKRIAARTGASTKSYSDMVKAADSYRLLAKAAQDQLNSPDFMTLPPQEQDVQRARIQQDVQRYNAAAASVLDTAAGKRLGTSSLAGAAPAGGQPLDLSQFDPSKRKAAEGAARAPAAPAATRFNNYGRDTPKPTTAPSPPRTSAPGRYAPGTG